MKKGMRNEVNDLKRGILEVWFLIWWYLVN